MLQEIFYWFFNMSITATITSIPILFIRLIKKVPKRITVFLWFIPFLRLIFPFGLNNRYSLMTLISKFTTKSIVVFDSDGDLFLTITNFTQAADNYFPISYKTDFLQNIFYVATIVWSVIALILIILFTVTYCKSIFEVKNCIHFQENIYFSKTINTPAVFGIIKPKIILPETYINQNIELILLHEKTHIRLKHNLLRVIATFTTVIHWFNPFSWLFLKLFIEDLELSCDEYVVAKIGDSRKKEYALLLLESQKADTIIISAFGGAKIHKRIENILSFKKLTWVSLTVFIVFICLIFCTLITNAG